MLLQSFAKGDDLLNHLNRVEAMRTEKELDYLETLIPELAESATKKAHLDALSRGLSVTEIIDGKIVSIAPDGKITIIEDARPLVKVPNDD